MATGIPVGKMFAIKTISAILDFVLAYFTYRIVALAGHSRLRSALCSLASLTPFLWNRTVVNLRIVAVMEFLVVLAIAAEWVRVLVCGDRPTVGPTTTIDQNPLRRGDPRPRNDWRFGNV